MPINIDFPLILTVTVFITGIIALIDRIFFVKKRSLLNKKIPWYIEYPKSFFPILLIVLIIRSFIVQPYRVPTGSLEPTILPGDFIAVNQFAYGLRLPVVHTKIWKIGEPKIGDIALFRWPIDPSVIFIKRVIGTPKDHIVYKDKKLYINGKLMTQEELGLALDEEGIFPVLVSKKIEHLNKKKHYIFTKQENKINDDFDLIVPKNHYFMMGDNRDSSDDSRVWGWVPEKNLIGKAFGIWMSWDSKKDRIRWQRIGKAIR